MAFQTQGRRGGRSRGSEWGPLRPAEEDRRRSRWRSKSQEAAEGLPFHPQLLITAPPDAPKSSLLAAPLGLLETEVSPLALNPKLSRVLGQLPQFFFFHDRSQVKPRDEAASPQDSTCPHPEGPGLPQNSQTSLSKILAGGGTTQNRTLTQFHPMKKQIQSQPR